MGTPLQATAFVSPATDLRIFVDRGSDSRAAFWRINGYRASLLIWTVDEWERMDVRPADAQYHPSGVWCALRMD
jgi:hypothetical protein